MPRSSFNDVVVGSLLLALPLVFSTHTHEPFIAVKTALCLAAAALLWARHAWSGGALALRSALAPLAFAFLAAAVLATVTSIDLASSLYGRADSGAALGCHVAVVTVFLAAPAVSARVQWAVIAAGVVVSLYALVQVAGGDPIQWVGLAYYCDRVRPFATLGHANALGGYLAMATPLALALLIRERRWWLVAVLALFARVIVLRASRGALLATGVGCVVALVLLRREVSRAVAVGLSIAVALAGVGTFSVLAPRLVSFFSSPSRFFIYSAAFETFLASPITGAGLDTFQLAFQNERTPDYWLLEWAATPQHAHNEILQALATQGVIGGLVWLVAIVVAVRLVLRAPSERAGFSGVIAAAFVHALVSFHTLPTAILAVFAFGQLAPAVASGRAGARWLATAAASAVFVLLGVCPLVASVFVHEGDARLARRMAGATDAARLATIVLPWSDWVFSRYARVAVLEGRDREALFGFVRAREISPLNAYHHANLARFLARSIASWTNAERRAHVSEMHRAVRILDPANVILLVDMAASAERIGDREWARAVLADALARTPSFAHAWALLAHISAQDGDVLPARVFFANALAAQWHEDDTSRAQAERALALLGGDPNSVPPPAPPVPIVPSQVGCW